VRERKKVLWVGDGVAATGFARVNHSVIKHLDYRYGDSDWEIHHLAVNYHGDPQPYLHDIYPATTIFAPDIMGYQRLHVFLRALKPDLVFILNDIWAIAEYFKVIPEEQKTVIYFPIDAVPLKAEWFESAKRRYKAGNLAMCVYTKFGRDAVKDIYNRFKVHVIPHGVEKDKFFPIPMEEVRAEMGGLKGDEWIVLNTNRNQPRKRIDITIKGFAKFAQHVPPNVKLYLHMALFDAGWDIINLIERYGLGDRFIISDPDMTPLNPLTTERLNYVYNACDVGINTSLGEGWGLCSWEHSACGKPQIVPNHSACAELYGYGRGILLPIDRWITHVDKINTEGGLVHEDDVATSLMWAYTHQDECKKMAQKMTKFMKKSKFGWANIAKKFEKVFLDLLG